MESVPHPFQVLKECSTSTSNRNFIEVNCNMLHISLKPGELDQNFILLNASIQLRSGVEKRLFLTSSGK